MSRAKLMTWLWVTVAVLAFTALPSLLFAQLNDDVGVKSGPMPTFSGKRGKVTEAINADIGAIFDLGGGITMMFPKGLPVGRSRLVTLQKARGRMPTKLIKGFQPVGPALDFTGAFNTSSKPMVLSVPSKSNPARGARKLVLAMEIGTFCEGENKKFKLKGGLCSGFDLHDAEYDAGGKRVVANLRSTGGLRMQFGTVPESSDDE